MTGPSAPVPLRGGRPTPRRRRRRRPGPCDVPQWPHDLTYARLYPCGWRCDRHSPGVLAAAAVRAGLALPPPGRPGGN
jgi:hypothetical protein